MAIIKFTCFHTGGMCFAGTSTVVAAFCGCCSGSSGSGVFSLLAAPLYQLFYPRPDETSSVPPPLFFCCQRPGSWSSALASPSWKTPGKKCCSAPLLVLGLGFFLVWSAAWGWGGEAAQFIGGRCDSRCCDLQLRWMHKSTNS